MGQAWKWLHVIATCTHLARTRSHGPRMHLQGWRGKSGPVVFLVGR